MKKEKVFSAFTLAEVLIVLGVIGIVASLTIPTLISNYEDHAVPVALKREASVIQQAINMAHTEEGTIDRWYTGTSSADALTAVNTVLSKYLKVAKNCGTAALGCLPSSYGWLSKTYISTMYDLNVDSNYSKMSLVDGSILFFNIEGANSADTPYITRIFFHIDVNGLKGPNRWGYDLFRFYVLSEAYVKSLGASVKSELMTPYGDPRFNLNSSENECVVTDSSYLGRGGGCAVWVYYHGNRDYLHCDGLGPTKTKCD